MKKVISLQVVVLFLGIISIMQNILNLPEIIDTLTISTSLVLQIIIIFYAIQRKKLIDYLVVETKRKNNIMPEWSEDESGKLELLRKRLELSMLQHQINPHFLYNTLDSIRSQALIVRQPEIAAMTEKLSRFFRYCISNKEGLVKIQEEINNIQDYYYIQKYRFEDRFDMEIDIEQDRIYDLYIPKMTLQPLVENAISHGVEKVSRKGLVKISLSMTDLKVVVKIADNGIGMTADQLSELNERLKRQQIKVGSENGKHNGIALVNVNSRIQLTFGEEYGIHYRSKENSGTIAEVTLPIIDDFQRAQYETMLPDRKL